MSDERVGQVRASEGEEASGGLDALTEEVLPALIARLRASRLGELEVRRGDWRVRLRRDGSQKRLAAARSSSEGEAAEALAELSGGVARSPAVGYFDPSPDLAVGWSVQGGDQLGTIDMLGIVQDVISPCDGIVSAVLADDGQAVEYGQALVEIDALEAEVEPGLPVAEATAGEVA